MARDRAPASSIAAVDTGASVLYGGKARYGVAKTVYNRGSAYRAIAQSTGGPPPYVTFVACGDPSHRLAHFPEKYIDLAQWYKGRRLFGRSVVHKPK